MMRAATAFTRQRRPARAPAAPGKFSATLGHNGQLLTGHTERLSTGRAHVASSAGRGRCRRTHVRLGIVIPGSSAGDRQAPGTILSQCHALARQWCALHRTATAAVALSAWAREMGGSGGWLAVVAGAVGLGGARPCTHAFHNMGSQA
eukprot:356496-Chlamydomonas_euryale.AAC.2